MSATTVSRQDHVPGGPAAPRDGVGFGLRFVIATSAGSVLNPVNSSIIAVALVSIGRAFGAGAAATTWLVSALYLATAIGQPAMGRLADQAGPRRVYLAGLALVAAGGIVGWQAPSLGVLVAARVVLGAGTSAAYPAAMAMVRRQAQRVRADPPGSVLGALAVAGQATMAVGPPLGGLLIAAGGWRLTFAINLPLAAAGAAFALAWLPKDEPARLRLHALDLPGAVLFAATLTALLLFLMNLRAHPWWLLAVAAAVAVVLAWRELAAGSPFIDVRMLAHNRALTTTYLRFGVTMLVTYCFIYGWTLWLEQAAGKSAATAGLLMIPSFAAAAGVSALAARSRRIWPLLLAGAVTLTAGSLSLFVLGSQSPLWMLAAVSVVFGVQNGLSVVTNQAAMYAQAPAAQTGAAAGLLRTFMYLGAITSAGIIGFAFGARASDAGLHQLAVILTAVSAVLLAGILLDRDLRHRVMTMTSAQQRPATRHRAAAARAHPRQRNLGQQPRHMTREEQMPFGKYSTAAEVISGHDLTGKETIVTGGAGGLGLETARALAGAGARVVLAGRDPAAGEAAAGRLRAETGNDMIIFWPLDLGSLESVTTFAAKYVATRKPLHILINNAGIMATPMARTADGFESQFGINHLGHFALTTGLLPALRAAGTARVASLSSRGHRRSDIDFDDPNYLHRPYDPWQAYGQSKTANALFAVGLTARHAPDGITCNAVMPGTIMTGLMRHISREELVARGWAEEDGTPARLPGWKTPEQGAATSIWAAVVPELQGVGGKYLEDCAVAEPWTKDGDPPFGYYLPYALDPGHAQRLWELSEKLTQDHPDPHERFPGS